MPLFCYAGRLISDSEQECAERPSLPQPGGRARHSADSGDPQSVRFEENARVHALARCVGSALAQNELLHAHDILEKSIDLSISAFQELYSFALEKGIPLGCNVESVSLRRAEIDASVEMLHRVAKIMGRD
jgi:hypothetical protein